VERAHAIQQDTSWLGADGNEDALQRHAIISETLWIGDRPVLRLHSTHMPIGERIAIPMQHYTVFVTRWPLTSTQDAVFEQFLAQISLPAVGTEAIGTTLATLHSGPAGSYPAVGSIDVGDVVSVVGCNATGDWLQLRHGQWVEARWLLDVPVSLPVVAGIQLLPTVTPTPPAPSSLASP
jgi:hypothetical protein